MPSETDGAGDFWLWKSKGFLSQRKPVVSYLEKNSDTPLDFHQGTQTCWHPNFNSEEFISASHLPKYTYAMREK